MKGTYSDPIVIGSEPSRQRRNGSRLKISLQGSPGFVDNENSVKGDMIIGRSTSISSSHSESPSLSDIMDRHIGNRADQIPRPLTSGKKIPVFKEHNLNWDENLSTEMNRPTGNQSGTTQSQETSWPSPQMSEYVIIVRSKALRQTIFTRLQLFEPQVYIGAHLELAKLVELGKRPAWRLILRIPGPNGGTDMLINSMLFSMNFEERLTYRTFSGGWTVTQFLWKEKALPDLSWPTNFGSHPTYLHRNGIPTWMSSPWQPY